MKYKVIKPFGCAEVGDIFAFDKETDSYCMTFENSNENEKVFRQMYVDPNTMWDYLALGIVEQVEDKKVKSPTKAERDDAKLALLDATIKELKETYTRRNEKIQKKYNAGKIPTCQKVEHDTVYFNMMKLLNKFESILNE